MFLKHTLPVFLVAALAACSSSDDGGGAGGGGAEGATSGAGGQGGAGASVTSSSVTSTSSAGGSGGMAAEAPEAPVMKGVAKMSGALHVSWTNVTSDCDAVHLSRNENGGAYAEIKKLAGAATSLHDAGASNSAISYCYTASCERAGLFSAESNEKCGTP